MQEKMSCTEIADEKDQTMHWALLLTSATETAGPMHISVLDREGAGDDYKILIALVLPVEHRDAILIPQQQRQRPLREFSFGPANGTQCRDHHLLFDDTFLDTRPAADPRQLAGIVRQALEGTVDLASDYASRMRKLPIGKYGALLIASKQRLARYVEQIARGPVAA